jgi:hypothetical protein
MKPSLKCDIQRSRLLEKSLIVALGIIAAIVPLVAGQDEGNKNCGGLHAGIRAELVRRDPNYSRPAFVMVSFVLLNDGGTPIESTKGGWQIVIDGKELSDSGYILFNGMQPDGGWGILNPGESYEFGRELEISRYLPKLGEHTLSWKGQLFQSSTIKVNVTPQ